MSKKKKSLLKKRLFTNSMLGAWRSCKAKYRWGYIEELAPLRVARPLRYGDLSHLLLQHLYLGCDLPTLWVIAEGWITVKVEGVVKTLQEGNWGNILAPEEVIRMPLTAEAEARAIFSEVKELITYYAKTVYPDHRDRYEVIMVEQRFEVPFVTRSDKRHRVWRYSGKWDLVVRDRYTGRILIIDHKTTAGIPSDQSIDFNLSTQPVAYSYAGLYLSTVPIEKELAGLTTELLQFEGIREGAEKAIFPDVPFWPRDVPPPDAFAVNVIRKKVPKKPEILKTKTKEGKAKISKSKGIDTTHEMYLDAILKNGLDASDYHDVLERLEKRGNVFHAFEELTVGPEELERWVDETRVELENITHAETNPRISCCRTQGACNMFGLCPYHPLCWGDEEAARGMFRHRPVHDELNN